MDAWIWGAVGAALAAIEVSAPGFALIFPALGALVAALAVFAGVDDLAWQIGIFAVASSVLFALCFQRYRDLVRRRMPPLVNSPERLVGALALVEDPIAEGVGKVRLGDSVWLCRGPDLAKGSPVRVKRVDGTVLVVERRE